MFADPIFLTGDYPASVKEYVSTFGLEFSNEEKQSLNGTADIFAHDAYTSQFYMAPDTGIAACVANSSHPLFPACANTTYQYTTAEGGWLIGPAADQNAPWLHKATDWVPAFLRYIQDTWKPRGGIAVTEFGFAEPFEDLKALKADILFDLGRTTYYHDYMEAILLSIADGVNVIGTMAWSIVDNLEWSSGEHTLFFRTVEPYL
jgi:beta-glucosidase/6-phospho-beta-glucosidase/beta-galactosidase